MRRLLVLLIVVVFALTGCGGGSASVEEAELTTLTLLKAEYERMGLSASALTKAECVEESSNRFECVVTTNETGAEEKFAGTLTCQGGSVDDQCIFRGENRGG